MNGFDEFENSSPSNVNKFFTSIGRVCFLLCFFFVFDLNVNFNYFAAIPSLARLFYTTPHIPMGETKPYQFN